MTINLFASFQNKNADHFLLKFLYSRKACALK